MLAPDVAVVLPPSARSRVATLWELADSGADAEALLDVVLAGGLSGLSDLALISRVDGTTRVLVRGTPSATVTAGAEEEAVTAEEGAVWGERLFPGGSSVRLELGGTATADLELEAGLVRVSVLELGEHLSRTPPEGDPGMATEFSLEAQPAPVPERPVLHAVPKAPLDEAPYDVDETGDQPVVAPHDAEASDGEAHDVEPQDGGAEGHEADQDGATAVGAPPEFDRPPVPGQEQAPPVVSAPVATLVFSTGDVVEVDRAVLVGRAPEARRFASHEQPRTVSVMSPQQEISSTHLEIRPGAGADHGSAIVTDLGSTNGTVLVQPGLPPEDLQPGIAVSLIPGAVLDLGDGVTIQVTNP